MTKLQQDFPLTAFAIENFNNSSLFPFFDEHVGLICSGTILYPNGIKYTGLIYSTPFDKFADKIGAFRMQATAYYPTNILYMFYKIEGEFTIFPLFVPKN